MCLLALLHEARLTKIPVYTHLCPLEAAGLLITSRGVGESGSRGVGADKPECVPFWWQIERLQGTV